MADRVPSTSSRLKVGQQSGKGIGATKLVCGTMQMSGMNTDRDAIDKGGEHGCNTGGVDRATVHKSRTRFSSYLVNGGFRGFMYPDMIGYWLLGAGFTVVTTAGAAAALGTYSHVFTLAARASVPWLSVHSQIGAKNRLATNVRVNRLTFTANAQGFRYDGTFQGLVEGEVPGTGITVANESTAEILSSKGSLSLDYDPDGTPVEMSDSNVDGWTMVIANPLDTEIQRLFSVGRADLPQSGLDVTGTVEGLGLDYTNYERIIGGAVGQDSPSDSATIGSLDVTYQSAEMIATTAIPYSIRFEVPHAEVDLEDFQAEGTNTVDWTFPYRMVDDNAAPVRITLVNAYPSYAA